jgi:hypothetical protein
MAPAAWVLHLFGRPSRLSAGCRATFGSGGQVALALERGFGGGGLAEGTEVLQLALEVGWVLEVLVDAGEPHVGDRVELAEGVEELDADLLALDLALAAGPDRLFDVTGDA